jgi:hypothetical protein
VHRLRVRNSHPCCLSSALTLIRAANAKSGTDTQVRFTGDISSLRAHISRASGHWDVYRARCAEKNITINHLAIPRAVRAAAENA